MHGCTRLTSFSPIVTPKRRQKAQKLHNRINLLPTNHYSSLVLLAFGKRKMDNLRYVKDATKSTELSMLIISRWWKRSIGFFLFFFLGWLGLPSILQFHNICCRYNVCYIPWSICEVPQILLQRSWFKFPLSIRRCYRLHIHVHNDTNSSFICDIRI